MRRKEEDDDDMERFQLLFDMIDRSEIFEFSLNASLPNTRVVDKALVELVFSFVQIFRYSLQ